MPVVATATDVVALARVRRLARDGTGEIIRTRSQLSLRELAAEVGVSPATLLRWEQGQRTPHGPAALKYLETIEALMEGGRL